MARARPTLPLPNELLVKVFEHCEDYEWPKESYTKHPPFDTAINYEGETWVMATSSAKKDICNVRLVCRSFYDTSISSFGTMLGHRRFRLTKVGLHDLRDIGAVAALVPWIQTLTFASADVTSQELSSLETHASHVDSRGSMHRAIMSINQSIRDYNHTRSSSQIFVRDLTAALMLFPKLRTVYMDLYDCAYHLGGWLTTEQDQYVSHNFKCGTELHRIAAQVPLGHDDRAGPYTVYAFRTWRLYEPDRNNPAREVVQALYHARLPLQELRMSSISSVHVEFASLPKTLRTLCIPIGTQHVQDGGKAFLEALTRPENLEDLILMWDIDDSQTLSSPQNLTDRGFRALKPASPLRHFHLQGWWYVSQASLIEFVQHHSSSLRRLILIQTILFESNWLSTLHKLARVTRDRLEYLKVANVCTAPTLNIDDWDTDGFNTYTESQWPQFTCNTNFGKSFKLLPDSVDK